MGVRQKCETRRGEAKVNRWFLELKGIDLEKQIVTFVHKVFSTSL